MPRRSHANPRPQFDGYPYGFHRRVGSGGRGVLDGWLRQHGRRDRCAAGAVDRISWWQRNQRRRLMTLQWINGRQ
jgi:hypothetical protein